MADQPIQTSVAVAPVRPEGISARNWLERLLPYASVAVLFTALSIVSPYFLTVSNLSSVARQTAVINIIALGMTLIMISGGIDLSVGSVLAFSGICGTLLMERGVGVGASTLLGILSGLAWGVSNGVIVTQFKVPPFIATLGCMGMARGLTLLITDGIPVTAIPKSFGRLGDGNFFGIIPVPVVILLGIGVIMSYVLRCTRLGRYAYAIGGNPQA